MDPSRDGKIEDKFEGVTPETSHGTSFIRKCILLVAAPADQRSDLSYSALHQKKRDQTSQALILISLVCDDRYVALHSLLLIMGSINGASRIQFTQAEDDRDASARNLRRGPRTHTCKCGRPKDTNRMRFGGNLVDRTQPKTSLFFGFDTRRKLPTMDERCRPLSIQDPPPRICSFFQVLPWYFGGSEQVSDAEPPKGLWRISFRPT